MLRQCDVRVVTADFLTRLINFIRITKEQEEDCCCGVSPAVSDNPCMYCRATSLLEDLEYLSDDQEAHIDLELR